MPSFAAFGNDLYTGRRSIDFVGRRKLWYAIAVAAMALSMLGLGVRGLNLGLEFRGGSEFRISKAASQSENLAVDAVSSVVAGAQPPKVSRLGSDGVRVETDKLTEQQSVAIKSKLATAYKVPTDSISSTYVGPQWGRDVSNKALTGLGVFILAVALVIALYFRTWKMALSAIIALVHDLALTVGIYAIVGFEVTPASVIGFLTILGYSLYDTVVVFDKVRENTEHLGSTVKRTYAEAANLAVNQTLVRSINTSVVALLPVASILFIGAFVLGAGSLKDISLSLFVGIAAGTYSSIFIATPLLADLRGREPEMRAQAERVFRKRAEAAASVAPVDAADGGDVLAPVGAGVLVTTKAGEPSPTASSATRGQRQQPRRGGSTARGGRPGGGRR